MGDALCGQQANSHEDIHRRDVFIGYNYNPQHKATLAPLQPRSERIIDTVDDTAYTSCSKASSKPTTTKPETIDSGLTVLAALHRTNSPLCLTYALQSRQIPQSC